MRRPLYLLVGRATLGEGRRGHALLVDEALHRSSWPGPWVSISAVALTPTAPSTARYPGWEDVPFGTALAAERRLPVIVDDLVAAVGNFTMPERIVISGENARLAEVGQAALHDGIAQGRSRMASELVVDVQLTGFAEWARGAAVTAIRTFVLGSRR
ncbi:hypothetical protein OG218_22245 [Kineococcus sp. NBC_00420]|uniref:hypothetical protein n=1 Tax=Kineococcus sp. NBC_00420 TaxID=2903564 RepID=UPI002E1E9C88